MSGDMSLSQSLGGLRIANPDDEPLTSPTMPEHGAAAQSAPQQRPPPSSHSSSSTVTDTRRQTNLLPSFSHQTSDNDDAGLGFDPNTYSMQNTNTPSTTASRSPNVPSASHTPQRLSHRSSMPLDYAAQQAVQYPAHSTSARPLMREASVQSTSVRPISGMYNLQNTSSSSGVSSHASYGYRGDAGSPGGTTSAIARSGSRSSRQTLAHASSRESSRSYRQPSQQMNGGNGPLPPRQNSRRARAPSGAENGGGYTDGSYTGNSPVPASTEEWRDRGAAISTRTETNTYGQSSTRLVKKGVKDFNFGRTLGEGSYSTVLAATDRQTLKEYAIKVLDKRHIIKEKKVKYVNIERDTLNRLTEHPGVVRLYYTFQDERSLYFVLDLASGGELLGVLKKLGSFDLECTRFYSAQILDTISYMHSRGVIHRDLKPENVLLDRDMHVKITDFGTAKILSQDTKANGSRGPGSGETPGDPTDGAETDRAVSFVGTAEYVSPELLRDKNACKASDLWAFGCIVFQLLAGRPPFKAANEYLTFQKILALEYTFPDGFPEVARDLVERLLVLEPANRLPVEHIKKHDFFQGVVWGKGLWKQKAPRLKAYVPPAAAPIKLNGGNSDTSPYATGASSQHSSTTPATQISTPRPQLRHISELPPPSQLDIDWSPVLTHDNERILKLGNLFVTTMQQPYTPTASKPGEAGTPNEKPKFSRFFSGGAPKRRERLILITSSARLVVAAAGGNEKKSKMDVHFAGPGVNWKSFVDAKGLTAWTLDTKDKHLTFEDPRATTADSAGSKYCTEEWLVSLEQARELFLSNQQQSATTSYSGSSMLNGLNNSSLSSPADSLGGDTSLPMTGPSSAKHHHLRATLRTHSDDGSLPEPKGKKRFSKRHSKSGLAAVF